MNTADIWDAAYNRFARKSSPAKDERRPAFFRDRNQFYAHLENRYHHPITHVDYEYALQKIWTDDHPEAVCLGKHTRRRTQWLVKVAGKWVWAVYNKESSALAEALIPNAQIQKQIRELESA